MKVFLVRTPWEKAHMGFYKIAEFEPLHLEYLATAVKDKADVKIWDLWYEAESNLLKDIKNQQPEILGISLSIIQIYSAIRIAKKTKELSPKTVIIVGGDIHLTPGYFRNTPIDLICIGSGADVMRDLVNRIHNGQSYSEIPGTIHVQDSAVRRIDRKIPALPIDHWGLPDRTINKHLRSKYRLYHFGPMASTFFSKGCWNRCNFCSTWMKDGCGKYEVRDTDIVIQDLLSIKEPWVFVVDDDVFGKQNKVTDIVRQIDKLGIKKNYLVEATADDVLKHKELIAKWAKLGLRLMLIGLESPFAEDLKEVGKAASIDQNQKSIEFLRSQGIDVIASFILFPHWTTDHFKKLWQFVKAHRLYWVHYQCYTPLPGTKLFYDEFDNITSHNLDLFDMEHMLLKTKLPLSKWYWERFKINFKTYFFHRGFDKQVQRTLPLNPFHAVYRGYLVLLYDCLIVKKHHRMKAPITNNNSIESVLEGGLAEELLRPLIKGV